MPFWASAAWMATPSTAPESTSVIDVPTIPLTSSPELVVWSSVMAVRLGEAAERTGASFTGVTVMAAVSLFVLNSVLPPLVEASA